MDVSSLVTGFVNGGNSFGAAATLGTNDAFALNFETNNTTKMTVLSSGNVGIGTTGPSFPLEVSGIIQASGANPVQLDPVAGAIYSANGLWNMTTGNNAKVLTQTTGTSITRNIADANPSLIVQQMHASSTGDILQLKNSASTVMTVQQGGNVGIGMTSPTSKLTISRGGTNAPTALGTANEYLHVGGAEQGVVNNLRVIGFGYLTTEAYSPVYVGMQETSITGSGKGDLVFGTRSVTTDTVPSERMRIDSSGNVGIGTTSPASKLQVNGAISNSVSTFSGAFTCGTSSIDFSTSNFQRLSPSAAIPAGTCNVALTNLVAGSNYTLIVTGNAATNAVTFNFTGYTFKYLPTNAATTAAKDSIYTFLYDGTSVYVTWSGGY
jgi:hypothetical protein